MRLSYAVGMRLRVIKMIGEGVVRRTMLFAWTGTNYNQITKFCNELCELGYIGFTQVHTGGKNPKRYFLTDRGVEVYRFIGHHPDLFK